MLEHRARIDDHALVQYLLHEQHAELRAFGAERGLAIYGDLQIGIPPREAWAYRDLLLRDYRMGAPPSRTNPEGQPWGYPLLDPAQCHAQGAAYAFARARADKLFAEYDALRIDHPHGWICPWVYRLDDPDALHAVQNGARLFSSPDRADHPALARHAIVATAQLDRALPPYDEAAVRGFTPAQIDRYARLFDLLVEAAGAKDRLICEVLSTQPAPLRAVLERHGLGRFRVTQKANLADDADVYRTENARAQDWVMVGTHDTPSIWACVDQWREAGTLGEQADYLARRLAPSSDPARARQLAAWLAEDPHHVAQAKLAGFLRLPSRERDGLLRRSLWRGRALQRARQHRPAQLDAAPRARLAGALPTGRRGGARALAPPGPRFGLARPRRRGGRAPREHPRRAPGGVLREGAERGAVLRYPATTPTLCARRGSGACPPARRS